MFAGSAKKLRGIERRRTDRLRYPSADPHRVTRSDGSGAVLECAPALASCHVIVGMAGTAMKGARSKANTGRKFMQFLNVVCHEVEPRVAALHNLGIVYVHHLLFSPLVSILHRIAVA
ncbi:hypothetical protein ACWA7J_21040 [Leptothrix sp. BB-4]